MSVWTECQHEKRFGFVSQWLIVCSSILYVDVFGVVCSKNCLELCDAIWRCYLLLSGYSSEFVDVVLFKCNYNFASAVNRERNLWG